MSYSVGWFELIQEQIELERHWLSSFLNLNMNLAPIAAVILAVWLRAVFGLWRFERLAKNDRHLTMLVSQPVRYERIAGSNGGKVPTFKAPKKTKHSLGFFFLSNEF